MKKQQSAREKATEGGGRWSTWGLHSSKIQTSLKLLIHMKFKIPMAPFYYCISNRGSAYSRCLIANQRRGPTLPASAWHAHTGRVNSLAGTVWITGTSDGGQPTVTQLDSHSVVRPKKGRRRKRRGRDRGEGEKKRKHYPSGFYVHTGRPSLPRKLQNLSSILIHPSMNFPDLAYFFLT